MDGRAIPLLNRKSVTCCASNSARGCCGISSASASPPWLQRRWVAFSIAFWRGRLSHRTQSPRGLFILGGRDVLNAIRERLKLAPGDLRHSERVLRDFGNLSSASVFFVLKDAIQDSARPGYWWMSSFGAGFSCHGALLKAE